MKQLKSVVENKKGRLFCYKIGGYVVLDYPSTCKFESIKMKVYEAMPFKIGKIELSGGYIICYDVIGTELKRWHESEILEVN